VLDVEGSARAGSDLREIIALSGEIKTSADRLGQKND
jgi:hypothetical protein